MALLDYLFPPQPSQVAGLLGVDEEKMRQAAQRAGLLNAGLGMIAASGPSRMPQGILQPVATGLMAGQQAYQGAIDQQLKDAMAVRKAQQEESVIIPEGGTLYGKTSGRVIAQGAPKQSALIKEALDYDNLPPDQKKAVDTYLANKEARKAPLVQNILGGQKLTPGQESIDKKFADDYVSWRGGGGQDMTAQIAQLKPVITALEAGQPITGMKVAVQPDLLLAMTNPKALQSREQVEEVVQRNLRAVLGAQFTEKEGERLIGRAYNPKLPPEENAKRLRRLFLQMSTAAEQKQAMVDYFDQNGTLRGFVGKMPSVQDFYKAMEGETPTLTLQDAALKELERRKNR